jgi:hypothetical protein
LVIFISVSGLVWEWERVLDARLLRRVDTGSTGRLGFLRS